jgi:hypothetical protein
LSSSSQADSSFKEHCGASAPFFICVIWKEDSVLGSPPDIVGISEMQDCGLHPLIYTWLESALAQDIENCQASDIRKREPPSTRPNMPMGDKEMKLGSDDPLSSYHINLLCFTMVPAQ